MSTTVTMKPIRGLQVEPSPETREIEQRIRELHTEHSNLERQLADTRDLLASAVADNAPRKEQERLQAECSRLAERGRAVTEALALLDERLAVQRSEDTTAAVQREHDRADQLQQQYEAAATALYQKLIDLAGPEMIELYKRAERIAHEALHARQHSARMAAHAEGGDLQDAYYAAREAFLTAPPLDPPHSWEQVWDVARMLARFAGCANVPMTSFEARQVASATAGLPTPHTQTL